MKHPIRIAVIAALVLGIVLACGQPAATLAQSPLIGGCPIFPANNIWNTPIDTLPVDARSAAYVSSIGATPRFIPILALIPVMASRMSSCLHPKQASA